MEKGNYLVIALLAILCLFCGCERSDEDDPVVNPQTEIYTGIDGGITYTLEITETIRTRAYSPQGGDAYVLTTASNVSSGSVVSFSAGTFILQPSNSGNTFEATVAGSELTALSGNVTWIDSTVFQGPGLLNNNQIQITRQPVDATYNVGGNATFSVDVTGSNVQYQWYTWQLGEERPNATWVPVVNGGVFSGATTPILNLLNVPSSCHQSIFYCRVSNAEEGVSSDIVWLYANNAPVVTITRHPADTTVVAGFITGSLTVEASVTQDAEIEYEWRSTSSDGSGNIFLQYGTSPSYALPTDLGAGEYKYFCVIYVKDWGWDRFLYSYEATVTVAPPSTEPPVITRQPVDATYDLGGSAAFTVEATGPDSRYQWYRWELDAERPYAGWAPVSDGGVFSGATTPTLTLTNTSSSYHNSFFYCSVRNAVGVVVSDCAYLYANNPPVVTITTHPADVTVVEGFITGSLTVEASATQGAALEYEWWSVSSDSNGITFLQYGSSPSFALPANLGVGEYKYFCVIYVKDWGQDRFSNTREVTVTVAPPSTEPPVITRQPVDATYDLGGSAAFTVEATGPDSRYQWYRWELDAERPYASWAPVSDGGVFSGATTPTLTLTNTSSTYHNSFFYCSVRNAVGVVVSDRAYLYANNPPVVTITTHPADVTVVEGFITGSLTVEASATQGAALEYEWWSIPSDSNGNTFLHYGSSPSFALPANLGVGEYKYFCVIYVKDWGQYRFSYTREVTVTVAPLEELSPVITITHQPQSATVTEGMIGADIGLVATVTPEVPLAYQWYMNTVNSNTGGTAISGETADAMELSVDLTAGTYYFYCVVSTPEGIASLHSDVAVIRVRQPERAVWIDEQIDQISAGEDKKVNFSVSTTSINNGTYNVSVANLPNGVEASGTITISSGAGILTFAVDRTAAGGSYNNLTLTLEVSRLVSVTSPPFTFTITSVPVIHIEKQPQDVTVTEGMIEANLELEASVTNRANLSYQWYANYANNNYSGRSLLGETSNSMRIPLDLTAGIYYFYCVVGATGGAISVHSNVATVTVLPPPMEIHVGEQMEEVVAGTEDAKVRFPVTVTNIDDGTYSASVANLPKWVEELGNTLTISSGAAILVLGVDRSIEAGSWNNLTLTIEVPGRGSVTSPPFTFTVKAVSEFAPTITSQPQDVSVYDGEDVAFAVEATGTPEPAYQWQSSTDGRNWLDMRNRVGSISGVYEAKVRLTPVSYSLNGSLFRCVVTNSKGSVTSQAATLTVYAP